MCGFTAVAGWPDRPPAGPFGAYTDYIAPRFALAALLAALDHRRRSGEGQYIDFSQGEAALHFLTPILLDWEINGRLAERAGNSDLNMSPHGVYAAAAPDTWVAIACETDQQWQTLAAVIGRADLAALTTSERLSPSGGARRRGHLVDGPARPDRRSRRVAVGRGPCPRRCRTAPSAATIHSS